MSRRLSQLERLIGPRPVLTLVVESRFVREIHVAGRAPIITIHDYDWGETDPDPAFDAEGFAFSPITWRGPAWTLGLSLHPPTKETYTMANQSLKTIPLTDLKISKLNMRHARKKPDISDLLPSIREHGVRQSLLVRKEGDQFGVVAGRRRLFALKQVAKETGIAMKVPCIVMSPDDDAEAIEASIIENAARLPASEVQQYEAFGRLSQQGRTAVEIAEYFGVTELAVHRILALANLISPIRSLFEKECVDRQTVYALTLATKEQQREWLRLYNSPDQCEPRGRNCKAWITGGAAISTDKALFELNGYEGQVITDLFGEQGVFADSDEFWIAQSREIASRVEGYKSAGWSCATVLERGHYFQSWDYEKRARSNGGEVFVEVRQDGAVTFHEGYISKKKARRADTGNASDTIAKKSELSGPLVTYILRHRHLAAGAEILSAPSIALRLMVAHTMVGSALWDVRPQPNNVKKEQTTKSLDDAPASESLAREGRKIEALFAALNAANVQRNGDAHQLCRAFSALLAMSDEEVMQVLAYTMAITLEAGSPVVEAVLHVLEVDMKKYWKPDGAFFDLVRDKGAINAMLADIGGRPLADTMLTETGKVQKEAIRNKIAGEGCLANTSWRPGWMAVPPTRYNEKAPSAPSDLWARVSKLFPAPEGDVVPQTEPRVAEKAAA